jgi:hypothetical protein
MKKPDGWDASDWSCSCDVAKDAKKPAAAKPYEAFEVVLQKCGLHAMDVGHDQYNVAVRIGGSWYAGTAAETLANRHCNNTISNPRIELDGAHALVWVDEEGDCWGGDAEWKWTEKELVVVGVGASGKPSVTPTIVVTRKEMKDERMGGGAAKAIVDIALDLKWKGDTLEIKGKTKGGDASVVGKHALAFP